MVKDNNEEIDIRIYETIESGDENVPPFVATPWQVIGQPKPEFQGVVDTLEMAMEDCRAKIEHAAKSDIFERSSFMAKKAEA